MSLRTRYGVASDVAKPTSEPVFSANDSKADRRTLTWLEIPAWQKDNEYILTGYRRSVAVLTWSSSAGAVVHTPYLDVRSSQAFQADVTQYEVTDYSRLDGLGILQTYTMKQVDIDLRDASVNIHTHLFGGLLFIVFLSTFPSVYFAHYESTTWADFAVFVIFLASAVFCLFSSSFYHTFSVHSHEVSLRCNAVDYAGIVGKVSSESSLSSPLDSNSTAFNTNLAVLTVGSFFPCIYYEFFCDTPLQILYLSLIVVVGMGAAYIVLDPEYRKPTHRGARTKVFIALGLCAVFPVAHGLVTHGIYKLWSEMGFGWLLASGLLYISGALL
ncbi:uncharacterized protein FIBRA_01621 [Fibroporia radiculosa]|uniref:Uncharacterized protein n=1 Tax=Fibroporia radiculosa TaxID=599839 RepID=J4G133_9APHY|nr:uncharacterized protein FIBRA_01621 [Fibroporia radiculosa]CCL99603.1 predicted protein [Fibroporia radiculosa]